jgi:DNA-binding response OmpR family regulator
MKGTKTQGPGKPAGTPRRRPASYCPRVLVVDEDSDLRQLYTEALAGQGYQVDAAADGAAAWEALRTKRYQLLITEHEMPNLTGVELVKMPRAAHMALPVVMAARRLPIEELARNPSLQLAAALAKPFAVDALLATVQDVLHATDSLDDQPQPLPAWRSQPSADRLWLW